jgi:3-oxoadipate enol-lactonase
MMASHIRGPLYFERMGRTGPIILFIHPNPMDQSWLYQMARFSTWYRCIAVDIVGYGRSPAADPGLTLADMADACWEVIDQLYPGESAILVGCSVGSQVAPQMYHSRSGQTLALVLSGIGFDPEGEQSKTERRAMRIRNYLEQGAAYRWQYTFEDLSPAFRATNLAHYFAELFSERNGLADVPSIIRQFEALERPRGERFWTGIKVPTIILSGSEDNAHQRALILKDKIPGCQLRVLPGAGHACQLEQPWLFDRFMIGFLTEHGLHPAA